MAVTRKDYENSCAELQSKGLLGEGEIPALPSRRPAYDDEVLGVEFFRTELAEETLEHLTLPRTYFGRSEIRDVSFGNTDLSESTANWNDFRRVAFVSSNLSNADLRSCIYEAVNFTNADLTAADLRHCSFERCDFTGAVLSRAKLTRKAGEQLSLNAQQREDISWQESDGEEPGGG